MDERTKHEEIKKLIEADTALKGKVHEIETCSHPFEAVEMLCKHDLETACAILDCIPPLSGAFILFCLCVKSCGYYEKAQHMLDYAQNLHIPAAELIRVSRGQIYRETNFLLP